VPAIQKLLRQLRLTLDDFDLIEINEAFAAQVISCCRLLDISAADPRLNAWGGAIAYGHPLAASGGRLLTNALQQFEKSNKKRALLSMCIGVGQGIAIAVEKI
jgi:acetyl-CoA acetyltransferase